MSIITVRVAKDVKQKLQRYGVNVSETTRNLLEKYLMELEQTDLAERLDQLKEELGAKIEPRQIAQLVREDRARR